MLFIKLTGVLVLLAATSGYGLIRALRYTKRLTFLRECRQVMVCAKEQMLYSRAELSAIFASDAIPESAAIAAQVFGAEFSGKPGFSEREYLTDRDRQILTEFATGLGMSDADGQAERCDLLLLQIGEQISEAAAESSGKLKLYSALGIGAGLCLTLIFI